MNIILPTLGKERQQTYSPFLPICQKTGKVLEVSINEINKILLSPLHERIKEIEFIVACDVSNFLTGPNGATYVFGEQKGATKEDRRRALLEYPLLKRPLERAPLSPPQPLVRTRQVASA